MTTMNSTALKKQQNGKTVLVYYLKHRLDVAPPPGLTFAHEQAKFLSTDEAITRVQSLSPAQLTSHQEPFAHALRLLSAVKQVNLEKVCTRVQEDRWPFLKRGRGQGRTPDRGIDVPRNIVTPAAVLILVLVAISRVQ